MVLFVCLAYKILLNDVIYRLKFVTSKVNFIFTTLIDSKINFLQNSQNFFSKNIFNNKLLILNT